MINRTWRIELLCTINHALIEKNRTILINFRRALNLRTSDKYCFSFKTFERKKKIMMFTLWHRRTGYYGSIKIKLKSTKSLRYMAIPLSKPHNSDTVLSIFLSIVLINTSFLSISMSMYFCSLILLKIFILYYMLKSKKAAVNSK